MTVENTAAAKNQPRSLDAFFWGGALIWAGLIFAADTMNVLPQIGQATLWSWIFLGAGLLGLVLNFTSTSSSNYKNPSAWDWGWSILFSLIGLSGFGGFSIPGWLFLIGIGVVILVSALTRKD